jgi:hypothetical protein
MLGRADYMKSYLLCGGKLFTPIRKADSNQKTWQQGQKYFQTWINIYRFGIAKRFASG